MENRRSKVVNLSNAFIWLMCVFLIRPYYIQDNNKLNAVWALLTCVVSFCSIIKIIKYNKGEKILFLLSWLGIMLIATVDNQTHNWTSVVSISFQVILAYNLGILWDVNKYRTRILHHLNFMLCFYLIADILLGITGISKLVFGHGGFLTSLGYDNYAAYIIIPMLAIKWCISIYRRGQLTKIDLFCWIGELFYKVLYLSFNAILGLLLFAIGYFLITHFRQKSFIKHKYAIIVISLALVGIIRFHIQDLASSFFAALGKGNTLGFRTVIWEKLWPALLKAPIVGYGITDGGYFQTKIGLSSIWDVEANHAHNIIFDIWFVTGIIGLVIYVIFLSSCIKGIRKNCERHIQVLLLGLSVYFLMGLFDGYPEITTVYTLLGLLSTMKLDRASYKKQIKCE